MSCLQNSAVCLRLDLVDDLLYDKSNPGIFQFLFQMMSHLDDSGYVVQTYEDLEESLGISRSTVARRLKLLKDEQVILPCRSGRNNGNKYRINPEYVWISPVE